MAMAFASRRFEDGCWSPVESGTLPFKQVDQRGPWQRRPAYGDRRVRRPACRYIHILLRRRTADSSGLTISTRWESMLRTGDRHGSRGPQGIVTALVTSCCQNRKPANAHLLRARTNDAWVAKSAARHDVPLMAVARTADWRAGSAALLQLRDAELKMHDAPGTMTHGRSKGPVFPSEQLALVSNLTVVQMKKKHEQTGSNRKKRNSRKGEKTQKRKD